MSARTACQAGSLAATRFVEFTSANSRNCQTVDKPLASPFSPSDGETLAGRPAEGLVSSELIANNDYSIRASDCPSSTAEPTVVLISATLPLFGAKTKVFIFIASNVTR